MEEKNGPRPQLDEQKFAANARYVRIEITKAPPGAWASFFEFEVLGKEMVEKVASDSSDSRLAGVQSPAGFEQIIFAGPPDISYPTCLAATPSGDVFVGVDQNGSLDREKNRGWVVRCRDTNDDGVADQFTTFAKMDSPRGLVFDHNTLYVMHPPLLEAYHDDNGDGVADRSEVLVRGLGNDLNFRGADHTCNGVRLGIDGWLYIALGDYGALNAVAKDGSRIQLHGGGIVRVRPDGSRLEVFAQGTRNTYDVAIDPFMNLFTCDNTNDGDEWNVRLSHMIATGNYGYPSLFKNFANETMPTMKDYGGGSPTGAFFLDEPGFPDEFGHSLYTCQWGWNNVTRHPLKHNGATFHAEKETFIRIPRPTGIAADGLGNIYVASWKGANFNYTGPNVGFVLRVSSLTNQPSPFPDLKKVRDQQLLQLLASPSATRRLHIQREILRRAPRSNFVKGLVDLASFSKELSVRAAAIFTLGQIQDSSAQKALVKLSDQPGLREFVLRVLADSSATNLPTSLFLNALEDKNPAVRLQAIIAMNRLQRTNAASRILPFVADSDPAISHAAFRALVSFRAVEACFNAIDKSDSTLAKSALRVLGNLHETQVVNGLIKRLETASLKPRILETLCRLYYREGDWDGSWWTTRPDSSGPYYKPVSWEATAKIAEELRNQLTNNDPKTLRFLLLQFQKYKIESPAISTTALEGLISDTKLQPALRKQAFQNVAKISDEAAVHALLGPDYKEKFISQLREEFVQDPKRVKNLNLFVNMANTGSEEQRELAYSILLSTAHNTNSPAAETLLAKQSIDAGKDSPALLRAQAAARPGEVQGIRATTPTENQIANLSYEEVVKRVAATPGDARVGAKLFEMIGCVKCHSVAKNEPPKGPFLGDIAARYNRTEIMESILHPSAQIAQGFETTTIELKDGDPIDGFIVRESGDEIEIRNVVGVTIIPKKNIAGRGTRTTSIMPDGLADSLTPQDLASLLAYLQSLQANIKN